ncbi:MAG: lamin tail domain-containing protein [Pontiellaceae bacterium]|nr:lamin tail domain-containing protein [Pontiellaceae bacterium]MBN2785161.1 lamin tail domain-containing protein [Pontiellaceae bacterium]
MQKRFSFITALFVLSSLAGHLQAAPVINEFMASNDSIYPDNCDFDDYSDWIEIHNPATTNVSLTDYYLTDDLTLPLKWRIPDGASIPADGFLMVRADGFDAGPGETRGRDYYPVNSTFVTKRYHAPFKLSAGGESLGIYRVTAAPVDHTLIAPGATWSYLDTGTDPGADWMKLTFDDSSWLSGAAELGYGDNDETTTVRYGPDSGAKYPTTFFRTHFTLTDPSMLAGISFRAKIDDGAIFYLNGSEVARVRMQDGDVSYLDYTTAGGSDYSFEYIDLPVSAFRAGDNVLAVEIHQDSGTSSDISLDAELIVSEINPADIVQIDAVTNFPAQLTDISYGRDPTSTNGWSFFAEPTPETANTTEALTDFVKTTAVTASLASGFYDGPQSIALSAGAGETIRYTLDGSVPDSGAPLYDAPLSITNTTVLRARSFAAGKIPGPLFTGSYFIDESSTLPVISFVADPATLFDDTIGIAENNTAYPFKGREAPIRLEMFEADKSMAFSVNAGAKIAGENIWQKAQKPFNIYMRSKYGDDLINYQMFPGEPVAAFGEVNLRNGGDDWEETMLRDAMMPFVLKGQMDNALYTYRPSIMYLNGEFWGIYNIRKRFDETYFFNEHQLSADDYDYAGYINDFVNDVAYNSATPLTANAGSTEAYDALVAFCTTNDPSDSAIYSQIETMMDIDSFADWAIATDFAINTSWPHNREFWRAHADGSRWQWIINDFDRGFDVDYMNSSTTKSLIDDFQSIEPLFKRLDNNTHFVNRLAQRYAAHIGSTLNPQRISDMMDILTAEQDGEVARQIARWPGSLATRDAQLAEIKNYFTVRPPVALDRLEVYLGISDAMAPLTFAASPANGGTIFVAGVKMLPEYNSTVEFYENRPVTLTAEPAPGFAFDGWSNGETNSTIEITLTGAETITANFTAGAETIIPSLVAGDLTLNASGSPYSVTNDLIVEAGTTLTLGAGVTIRMPKDKSIIVYGTLNANGTEAQPVEIGPRTSAPWGNIGFISSTGISTLDYVTIRGATPSRQDPLNLKGAVSGYNSELVLDHTDIEALLPVTARFGSTIVRNSRIHVMFTGDCINLKNGEGLVENCTLTGNAAPDVDGIDYDSVDGGVIRGNRIFAFNSDNGDAIDLGYSANVQVVSNRIFNIFDKGISVGQGTTVSVQRNLIVNCGLGMGIKDAGSTAYIDQNTFARNDVGVAVYVKVVGRGGGTAYISNCIFSRSKSDPVTSDALSIMDVNYSLSDTLALAGTGNLLTDPLFTDEGSYDFSLTAESPAIDSGDPAHALDTDGSRADMGAYYTFDPEDYPYFIPNLVVINEVLAHSHDIAPDWIELYNTSSKPVDLSGWYLSDDPDQPLKYRIADGTELPANGYIVFYEDLNFGAESSDAGAEVPFALSENGDTVNIYGPGDELRPDYSEKETFGASLRGVTRGRYYKASTRTYNFVAMEYPTPGGENSDPKVGPLVISEIMYHPPVSEAEYIEITNIDTNQVTLFDTEMAEPWRMTKGIDHIFSASPAVVLNPGERLLLVRNTAAFTNEYGMPPDAQVIQWDGGALDNGGETIELSQPGDTNEVGELQFVRIDRVDYSDNDPWPTGPDGSGTSLARMDEHAYGNDFANWRESAATPGQTGFMQWLALQNLPTGQDGPDDDPDGDGIATAMEYACGTDPMSYSSMAGEYAIFATPSTVSFILPVIRADLGYVIQRATQLVDPDWTDLDGTVDFSGGQTGIEAIDPAVGRQGFYRLKVLLYNWY